MTQGIVTGTLRGIATRHAKRAAMAVRLRAEVDRGSGLGGDFGRKPGRAQVTLLSEEAWHAACLDIGAVLPWTARRANLLLTGVPLCPLAGSRVAIGAVVFEVTGETDPCQRMDEAHAGLRWALSLQARGGVRCRILSGGLISVGDAVEWRPAMADLFAKIPAADV
jgi:MOSC domain-containing protein YiiM